MSLLNYTLENICNMDSLCIILIMLIFTWICSCFHTIQQPSTIIIFTPVPGECNRKDEIFASDKEKFGIQFEQNVGHEKNENGGILVTITGMKKSKNEETEAKAKTSGVSEESYFKIEDSNLSIIDAKYEIGERTLAARRAKINTRLSKFDSEITKLNFERNKLEEEFEKFRIKSEKCCMKELKDEAPSILDKELFFDELTDKREELVGDKENEKTEDIGMIQKNCFMFPEKLNEKQEENAGKFEEEIESSKELIMNNKDFLFNCIIM